MIIDSKIIIESIRLHHKTLEFRRPFETSHDRITQKKTLILELSSSSKRVYSECVALETSGYHPETLRCAAAAIEALIPFVVGNEWSIQELSQELQKLKPRNSFAVAAIEMGACALASEQEGILLNSFLGIPTTKVSSGIVLGIPESKELFMKELDTALQKKYHKIKCKVTPDSLPDVIDYLRCYPQLDKIPYLAFDANESFRRGDIDMLLGLEVLPLHFLEQSFPRDDWASHARLQEKANFSICLDESIQSLEDINRLIQTRAAKMVMIKPGKYAGFLPTLNILNRCQEANITCCLGGMFETGIGRAYNLALAGHNAFKVPPDLSESNRYYKTDLISLSFADDGYFYGHLEENLFNAEQVCL